MYKYILVSTLLIISIYADILTFDGPVCGFYDGPSPTATTIPCPIMTINTRTTIYTKTVTKQIKDHKKNRNIK